MGKKRYTYSEAGAWRRRKRTAFGTQGSPVQVRPPRLVCREPRSAAKWRTRSGSALLHSVIASAAKQSPAPQGDCFSGYRRLAMTAGKSLPSATKRSGVACALVVSHEAQRSGVCAGSEPRSAAEWRLYAGVAKWYCRSLPSCCCGFDSRRPLLSCTPKVAGRAR